MKEVSSMIHKMGVDGRDKSYYQKVQTNPSPQYWHNNNNIIPPQGRPPPSSNNLITVPVVKSVIYKNSNGDNVKSTTTEYITVNKNNPNLVYHNQNNIDHSHIDYRQNMGRSQSSPVLSRLTSNRNHLPYCPKHISDSQEKGIDHGYTSTDSFEFNETTPTPIKKASTSNSIKSILKKTSTTSVEKTNINTVVISPISHSRIVPRVDEPDDMQLVKAKMMNYSDVHQKNIPQKTMISPRHAMPRSVSENNNSILGHQLSILKPQDPNLQSTNNNISTKPPIIPKTPKSVGKHDKTSAPNLMENKISNNIIPRSRTSRSLTRATDSESLKLCGTSESMFSPTYTKVLSQKEMTAREAWAETQRRKAKMREEFFKLPYEELNWEIVNGRRSQSEPRRKSRNIMKSQAPSENSSPFSQFTKRDPSPEMTRSRSSYKSLPPSQRNNFSVGASNDGPHFPERGRLPFKFSPIKENIQQSPKHRKQNIENKQMSNKNIHYNAESKTPVEPIYSSNKIKSPQYIGNNNTQVPPTNSQKENGFKKTTPNNNEKSNSVDIYMTKGPSFSNHHLNLKSSYNPNGGSVTVRRYKVPQIPFDEKIKWLSKYAPEALGPLRKEFENYSNTGPDFQNMQSPRNKSLSNNLPLSPKSPTSPMELKTPSPTPSYTGSFCMSSASSSSSSGCYSGSCSPTPLPPNIQQKAPIPPTHL